MHIIKDTIFAAVVRTTAKADANSGVSITSTKVHITLESGDTFALNVSQVKANFNDKFTIEKVRRLEKKRIIGTVAKAGEIVDMFNEDGELEQVVLKRASLQEFKIR